MNKCLIILLLTIFVIPKIVLAEDPPIEVWVRTLGLLGDDWGEDITVDPAGYVYVTGNTYNPYGVPSYNWLTVKYDADGTPIWGEIYDSGYGDDIATAVVVDNAGNVYVVGCSPDNTIRDWRYIKYDADGNLLWNKIGDWGANVDKVCNDIVVDTVGGYLYMTGEFIAPDGSWDYLTAQCDLDGNYIRDRSWGSAIYNSGRAIAIDPAGYIYVTGVNGSADLFWATLKYDMDLNFQWSKVYNSSGADDHIPAGGTITVDHAGCFIVVGWVENASTDWQIVKYLPDGTFIWNKIIDTGNNDEGAWGVVVDSADYIYVNGDFAAGTTGWDCRTIKFDVNSNIQWTVTYDGGYGNDAGRGIAIDDSGFVYVVGHSYRTVDHDFLTIKYEQQTGIEEQSSGGYFSLLSLEVVNNPTSTPTLSYTLPAGIKASLSFYSADGRRIEEFSLNSSQSTFTWDASELPCGVYFARLWLGNQSISAKICLTR